VAGGGGFEREILHHLIAGERRGEPTRERRNPAESRDVVFVAPDGTNSDVDAAVEAAMTAGREWAQTPAPQRGAILTLAAQRLAQNVDVVARDLTREEGKTLSEAIGEVRRTIDILTFYGGEGWRFGGSTHPSSSRGTFIYTMRFPVGVVAVITPWNFPLAIPAWKIAPALVSGNSVVFKPASLTSLSASHLVEALVSAGLPDGVLNLVHGSGSTIGMHLVEHADVAAITFTGSTVVGNEIHKQASSRRARVQLEMGGKNPLLVLDDADVTNAANVAAVGAFGLTGQACTATSRVIVTQEIKEAFLDELCLSLDRYRPGNGLVDGVAMGPVVDEAQLETDLSFIELARAEGSTVLAGGELLGGTMLTPAVVCDVSPKQRFAREEMFGPAIAVFDAVGLEDGLETANDVSYGLVAGICTNDLNKAHEFADRIEAGVVKVNRPTTGLELNVPFGGVKESSTNTFREQGSVAVDFFCWTKSVYLGYGSQ